MGNTKSQKKQSKQTKPECHVYATQHAQEFFSKRNTRDTGEEFFTDATCTYPAICTKLTKLKHADTPNVIYSGAQYTIYGDTTTGCYLAAATTNTVNAANVSARGAAVQPFTLQTNACSHTTAPRKRRFGEKKMRFTRTVATEKGN